MGTRVIAIDWSGKAQYASRTIWLCSVRDGEVERLENGRDRDAVADFLLDARARDPRMIVGLDFAFSLPNWFVAERGLTTAPDLWSLAATDGEEWLSRCAPPFWGRPGRRRPELAAHLRRADDEVPDIAGIRPKSPFQVGGAGAVGTGSIRGMPILERLREGGFAVWPFDAPAESTIVEIYPRLLTDAVRKSSADARAAYLRDRFPSLDQQHRRDAERSEDAFDALVSALVMARHAASFGALPPARDHFDHSEGRIWVPPLAEPSR